MVDLRFILLCFCIASVLVIVGPLFLLENVSYDSAAGLKQGLQNSIFLEKAHILSLGSGIPLLLDLLLDLSSQTAQMASATQIKERITILLTLGAFNLSFIYFRDRGSVSAVYVGANSVRINVVLTAIYYAVYPGLRVKLERIVDYGFLTVMCCFVANVLAAYSVYFDSSSIATVQTIFQAGAMCIGVVLLFRWVKIIAKKQNVVFIRFDCLTTDEYATLSYVMPAVVSGIAQLMYAVISGELSWQSRSSTGLLVNMAITYALHSALIRKFISSPNPNNPNPNRHRIN